MRVGETKKERSYQLMNYFMESPKEAQRLATKTNPVKLCDQLLRAGLIKGMRFVDVGCGSPIAVQQANSITDALATGIDSSEKRIGEMAKSTQSPLVEFLTGDCYKLPLEDNSYDFGWSRFLFEYLKHPKNALHELLRVVKPGGIVCVADLDNQLSTFYPLENSNLELIDEALLLLKGTGFDSQVGRKLPKMFRDLGLKDIEVFVEPHQIFYGNMPKEEITNWQIKMDTAARYLETVSDELFAWQDMFDRILSGLRSGHIFYYSTLIQVVGKVPL